MKYNPLNIVVNDLCEVFGDHEHKRYVDVMKVVIRKVSRFNIFHESPYYRSTTLTVSNNYTAAIPSDCIKPVKVGIIIGNHIHSFYYNSELRSPKVQIGCQCTDEDIKRGVFNDGSSSEVIDSGTCSFCSFPNYYGNNNGFVAPENFSSRPYQTYAGWFNYEFDKDRIVFDPSSNIQPDSEVVLMYKSSIPRVNGDIIIPMEMWEMLEYAVLGKFGDIKLRQYYISKSEMEEQSIVRLYNKMTSEELEAAISGYKYLGIKR